MSDNSRERAGDRRIQLTESARHVLQAVELGVGSFDRPIRDPDDGFTPGKAQLEFRLTVAGLLTLLMLMVVVFIVAVMNPNAGPPGERVPMAERFKTLFESSKFSELQDHGARPQRLLWASTSTKNPAYSDTLYVDDLLKDWPENGADLSEIKKKALADKVYRNNIVSNDGKQTAVIIETEALIEENEVLRDIQVSEQELAEGRAVPHDQVANGLTFTRPNFVSHSTMAALARVGD